MVCVTPAAPPAAATDVVVTTLVDGEQVLVETLSADGVEHPVDQSECRGRRRIAWSDDGARLFTRAELTCSARDDARRLSAVGLMADDRTWLALRTGGGPGSGPRSPSSATGARATSPP